MKKILFLLICISCKSEGIICNGINYEFKSKESLCSFASIANNQTQFCTQELTTCLDKEQIRIKQIKKMNSEIARLKRKIKYLTDKKR